MIERMNQNSIIKGEPFLNNVATPKSYIELDVNSDRGKDSIISGNLLKPRSSVESIHMYSFEQKIGPIQSTESSKLTWELVYVDSGVITSNLEGRDYILEAGDLILYFPKQVSYHSVESQEMCNLIRVKFNVSVDASQIHALKNRKVKSTQQIKTLLTQFMTQAGIYKDTSSSIAQDLMITYLHAIILNLLDMDSPYSKQRVDVSSNQGTYGDDRMHRIETYIKENIHMPLSVQMLCDQFDISRSNLQVLFNKHYNDSPKHYINCMKLKQAQKMILEGEKPMTIIAEDLGFASIQYFSRKFKREFGMTPTEFSQSLYYSTV